MHSWMEGWHTHMLLFPMHKGLLLKPQLLSRTGTSSWSHPWFRREGEVTFEPLIRLSHFFECEVIVSLEKIQTRLRTSKKGHSPYCEQRGGVLKNISHAWTLVFHGTNPFACRGMNSWKKDPLELKGNRERRLLGTKKDKKLDHRKGG